MSKITVKVKPKQKINYQEIKLIYRYSTRDKKRFIKKIPCWHCPISGYTKIIKNGKPVIFKLREGEFNDRFNEFDKFIKENMLPKGSFVRMCIVTHS